MIKILFICNGNTCRSPMAEHIFRDFIVKNNINNISCDSAGFFAQNGEGAAKNAIEAMNEIGIDLTKHKAKRIEIDGLKNYDILVVMDEISKDYLIKNGVNKRKIYVLGGKEGIADPYLKNLPLYKNTRDVIKCSVRGFVDYVRKFNLVRSSSIVKANFEHVASLCKLEHLSYSDPWSFASIRDEICSNSSYFVVAMCGSCVAAYACMRFFFDRAEILKVTTACEFRGFGLAEFLMKHLVSVAKKRGFFQIFLEVRRSNIAALKLYEKCGFVIIAHRRNFYSQPVEDAISMCKTIG